MSMAIAYNMKKRRMAEGGDVKHGHYAEGGEVCPTCQRGPYTEGGDVVDRIMGKYSEGGKVANDTDDDADFDKAQFDDLPLEDDLSEHETAANSGDEIGDAQEDDDRHDIVARIMRSRGKRDKNPRPA